MNVEQATNITGFRQIFKMKVKLRLWLMTAVLLILFVSDGMSNRQRRNHRRDRSRGQDLMQLLSLIQSRLDDGADIHLTPSPPTQSQVQCHVTVQQTVHIGGRCVFLGSQYHPACQSGPHLDPFNSECRARRRHSSTAAATTTTHSNTGSSDRRGPE